MAGFKTHITTSTVLGVAYGGAAFSMFDVPLDSCLLATALCSVSGMLPDLDSDSGTPLKESLCFAAAALPMMLVNRFREMGVPHETMILAAAVLYLMIRFGVGTLLKKYTVHRGMFHSIPACLIAAEITFLACSNGDLSVRYFKTGAVIVGFMSHLILDEIWSIDLKRMKLKKSSGTAIKFWSDCGWANASTYIKLILLSLLVLQDPVFTQPSGTEPTSPNFGPQMAETRDGELKR